MNIIEENSEILQEDKLDAIKRDILLLNSYSRGFPRPYLGGGLAHQKSQKQLRQNGSS